jgi:ketosteroid isomerase-like protein
VSTGARDAIWDDVDRMDADAWAAYLAPDAVMRFGNADPVHGREACRDALAAFFGQIGGLRHEVIDRWQDGRATITEIRVTYTRKDGRDVTVPAVTIFRTGDADLIVDYRIFVDQSPLFA